PNAPIGRPRRLLEQVRGDGGQSRKPGHSYEGPRVQIPFPSPSRFSAVTSVAVLYRSSGATAHPAAAKVAVKSWAEQVSDLTCLRRPTQNLTRAGRIGPRA